ncbi:hypothetical protein Y695_02529 [Hydrogenophaga sp. T4]|nr:hypothetical protein Y695_02529 [Hydrogenophaga sp. T4]
MVSGGVQAHLQPQAPGLVPVFHHLGSSTFARTPVRGLETCSPGIGKDVPDDVTQHVLRRRHAHQAGGPVVGIHQALIGSGRHERVGHAAEHVLQQPVGGVALQLHPLLGGHVIDQADPGRPPFKFDVASGDLHVNHATVLQPVGPGASDLVCHGRCLQLRLHDALQPVHQIGRGHHRQAHRQELIAAVAVVRHGGVVDGEKLQRLQIDHPHRLRVVLEQQPVASFAILQLTPHRHHVRDVAGHAEHTDGAGLIAQGALDRIEGAPTFAGIDLVLQGLDTALAHDAALVLPDLVGLFGGQQILDPQTQHRRHALADHALGFLVDQQIAPLPVLGKDRIGRAVHPGLQQCRGLRLPPQGLQLDFGQPLHARVHAPEEQEQQSGGHQHEQQAFPGLGRSEQLDVLEQQLHQCVGPQDPEHGHHAVAGDHAAKRGE